MGVPVSGIIRIHLITFLLFFTALIGGTIFQKLLQSSQDYFQTY
jgi:hypothetical protein